MNGLIVRVVIGVAFALAGSIISRLISPPGEASYSWLIAPGAALAGALVAPLYGRPGATGWLAALSATILATLLVPLAGAAVLAVIKAQPGFILMLPLFALNSIATTPAAAGAWLLTCILIHGVLLEIHKEHQSRK